MAFKVGDRVVYCDGKYECYGGKKGFEIGSLYARDGHIYATRADGDFGHFDVDYKLKLWADDAKHSLADCVMALELSEMLGKREGKWQSSNLSESIWLRAQAITHLQEIVSEANGI